MENHGIEGDAHAGRLMKHRYLAKRQPTLANNRQIHLIQCELFDELAVLGFQVKPGDLGENITTGGIDLPALPLGCILRVGSSAVIELTGLRTPCGYIDRFRKGLKRTMTVRTGNGHTFRAGVLGVIRTGGEVVCGDSIAVELPAQPWKSLPAL
jgi:MOSC domain-containing protein YiiM